jgi:hypothetical protein
MTWHDLAQLATPSLAGVVTLGVLMIFTGRLVPAVMVRKLVDAQRQRADDFKAAADAAEARADRLAGLLAEFIPAAKTTEQAMRAIEAVASGTIGSQREQQP